MQFGVPNFLQMRLERPLAVRILQRPYLVFAFDILFDICVVTQKNLGYIFGASSAFFPS